MMQQVNIIPCFLLLKKVRKAMDHHGHLFNYTDFTKGQVDLLETTFQSVRNRLEVAEVAPD
jgi:hypothetical protein